MGEARIPPQDDTGTGAARLDIIAAAARASGERGIPPVESWNPPYCGDIGLSIGRDGVWRRDGTPFTRPALVRLFSTVLRKDEDGRHYLVTPVEKVDIAVDIAPFLAVRVDVLNSAGGTRLRFTTNVGDEVDAGPDRPIDVTTDADTLEPTPLVRVRGRLDALMTRAVFFELVDIAIERETPDGPVLGVESGGAFFALGPAGAHLV